MAFRSPVTVPSAWVTPWTAGLFLRCASRVRKYCQMAMISTAISVKPNNQGMMSFTAASSSEKL
jgi:hypothetical protein